VSKIDHALALERRFPGIGERLARVPLTRLPTTVQPLTRLGHAVDIERLWVKRDDRTGQAYGGNKLRKLEFILGDLKRRGRRSLITFGGIGTNHGLATAICARQIGLKTVLVLVPQPVSAGVRSSLLLGHAHGAELHYAPTVARAAATTMGLIARGILAGDLPAIVPPGGTSVLGTLGYVDAALELAEQVAAGELPEPDWIFVPLGSGGTATGLALGLKLAGLRSRVAAVLVTDILAPAPARLARLGRACLRRLRRAHSGVPHVRASAEDLAVLAGYVGRCYGAATREAEDARRLMEECEGIRLETTYSAKCLAALLAVGRRPPYGGKHLLFWNTYSSVDPAAGVARMPDFRELPRPFHRFFWPD